MIWAFFYSLNLLYEIYVFSWNSKTIIIQGSFSLVPKTEKQQHCPRKNMVPSVNGSYGTVGILAYLSSRGWPQTSLEVCTLPGTFSSTPSLCCPHGLANEWYPLAHNFLVFYAAVLKHQHQHRPCKQIQRTLPHIPDLLTLRMGRFNVQDTGEPSPEPLFPPVGINKMLLFFFFF